MANRAFLSCCDIERIYPSLLPDYDENQHTIAASSYCVPMLWLGLFSPEDLRIDEIETEIAATPEDLGISEDEFANMSDEEIQKLSMRIFREPAPFAEKDKALNQLSSSLQRFDNLFEGRGSVTEHIDYLFKSISSAEGKYVTIELEEIAWMGEKQEFYDKVETILKYLQGSDVTEIKKIFGDVSTVDFQRTIYPLQRFFEGKDLQPEDYKNLAALVGYEWFRPYFA